MRRHRTLKEYTAIVANIIYKQGEISYNELVDALESRGVSHWVFRKLKPEIFERLATDYSDIKMNSRQSVFFIGRIDDSLSSLSLEDKEKSK